jgi:two-component system chemotaxis sensor kinase CheA
VDKLAKKKPATKVKETSAKQQGPSLDDIASRLVQLEPSDLPEVVDIWEALRDVSKNSSSSIKKLIDQAIEEFEEIIEDRAENPSATISEVGQLIEEAMYRLEEESKEVPKESKETKKESEPKEVKELKEKAPEEVKEQTQEQVTEQIEESPKESLQKEVSESLPPDTDLDLLGDFITESRELIEGAEAALLTLETDPDDTQAISTVFRAFHTVKGTSGFLGLTLLAELSHNVETILSHMRDGKVRCTGGYADLSLRSIDLLKELLQIVQDALGGESLRKPEGYDDLMHILSDPKANGISEEQERETETPRVGDILVAQGKAEREEVEEAAAIQGEQPIGEALIKSETASVTEVAQAIRTQKRMKKTETSVGSSVRVRTDRLDSLIETVGELVISQSMVTQDQLVSESSNHELLKKVTQSGKIVRELQDLTMSMRMVPLKPAFQKMARIVRDLARKSGKKVSFTTEGEDTEIDRNMVDIINDPLVHLVRNAVDHGIESPDIRKKEKKPKEGAIHLLAYHSAGSVVVEMKDDGKGLDKEKITEKAISKGLIETSKGMSENEIFSLIFEPGFSTADKVTEVSGRGVGLDVVKRGIQALRGRVDISSEPGKGTTLSLRLPLTLAITDGMLVKVGEERYIVPTVNIHLSFRPQSDDLSTAQGRGEMVMLRGELMSLYRLHHLFNVKGAIEDPTEGLLIIMSDGSRRYALLVDELLSQQQVVAKSLGDGIGKIPGVFGGAILGDGNVGLILDPPGISSLAKQVVTTGEREGGMVYS